LIFAKHVMIATFKIISNSKISPYQLSNQNYWSFCQHLMPDFFDSITDVTTQSNNGA
jgi:hypothetical protein